MEQSGSSGISCRQVCVYGSVLAVLREQTEEMLRKHSWPVWLVFVFGFSEQITSALVGGWRGKAEYELLADRASFECCRMAKYLRFAPCLPLQCHTSTPSTLGGPPHEGAPLAAEGRL